MLDNLKLSIVIPCYNEEAGLIAILKKMPSFVDEVIVVDNNSLDNTSWVARQYKAQVVFVKEPGYGLSLQKGLANTTGDIIITIDGDCSYPVNAIEKMVLFMEQEKYDFISGCRFPLKNQDSIPFLNKVANRIISLLIRLCFKVNIIDSQSGMWIFRKEILPKIISSNPGMGFSQEIKLNTWLNPAINCAEFHIDYQKREGQSKFRGLTDSFKIIFDMLIFLMR